MPHAMVTTARTTAVRLLRNFHATYTYATQHNSIWPAELKGVNGGRAVVESQ